MSSIDLGSPEVQTDDKKLWLDYLSKLRDRADRSNQVTGVTNWVLYGIMGTLLYKGIGFFPLVFSDPDFRYNTYIFVILGLNVLVLGQQLISEVRPSIKEGAPDIRALPDRFETLLTDYFPFFFVFTVLLGLVELWMGYQNPHLNRVVRYSFFGFGTFHFILGLAIGYSVYFKHKIDAMQPGMILQFWGAPLRGEKTTNVFILLAATAASASIILHVRGIMHTSSTWLLSVQSMFGILIFLWATYKLIVLRPTQAQITDAITALERQALVDNLSAAEIRKRFTELTSGKRLEEWLQESSESATKIWENIWNYLEAASVEVTKVCLSPPSDEKIEELRSVRQKIEKNTAEYTKPFAANSVQVGATVAVNWAFRRASSKDAILRFSEYKKEADKFDGRLKALFQQLDSEVIRTTDELSTRNKKAAFQ